MIKVSSVYVKRAEGRTEECTSHIVHSLHRANEILATMARTAPETGGYDKCDFVVTYEDGETYEGRFDLKREHRYGSHMIEMQMLDVLKFYMGVAKPSRMTEEQYLTIITRDEDKRAGCVAFIADREIMAWSEVDR